MDIFTKINFDFYLNRNIIIHMNIFNYFNNFHSILLFLYNILRYSIKKYCRLVVLILTAYFEIFYN